MSRTSTPIALLRALAPALLSVVAFAAPAQSVPAPALEPCRLKGIDREVRCGSIEMPEDPDAPGGRRIRIHFAVQPAVARDKRPDPVFVFAGGPGQSARAVAGALQPLLAPLNARRDLVYIDQRGTGRSNPLACRPPDQAAPLSESLDAERQITQVVECVVRLRKEHDLAQYATWIAMRDVDAVRGVLGYAQVNLWSASYGTRAALEYLRQYPDRVRSAVLDGMAPATMQLPASFAVDGERALARLVDACALDAACRARHPGLAASIDRLLAAAADGIEITVPHPLSGQAQSGRLDRGTLANLLRAPLYAPTLAAVLPYTLAQATGGNYAPLVALATAVSGSVQENFAEGMHFAVICAEDMPRVDAAAAVAAASTRFGTSVLDLYRRICGEVPVRPAPAGFFAVPAASAPVLLLSGGVDPATPPRHAETVAKALPSARHLVAPNLGHGVSMQGCAPELVQRFIRQGSFDGIDGACLQRLPPPRFFEPPRTDGR
jgi:pimeloyl-ACP methyl ester carboxylesterase